MRLRPAIIFVAAVLAPTALCARTWHVNPDGTGDAPTIQAAVDSTAVGDTVRVGRGSYLEHDIIITHGLVLIGDPLDPSSTTIDAGGLGRGLIAIDNPQPLTVRGITLTGAFTDDPGQEAEGGAILCSGTDVDISQCRFLHNQTVAVGTNWSRSSGAGIYAHSSLVKVHDCLFLGNRSGRWGGAIHTAYCTLTVTDCVFFGNEATPDAGAGGGAIYATKGSTTITRCVFRENQALEGARARGTGGAIWADDTMFVVEDSAFSENLALTFGGAIYANQNTATIVGSSFRGNKSSVGTAIIVFNTTQLTDCLFVENVGLEGGVGAALTPWNATLTVEGCTLFGNRPFAMNIHNGATHVQSSVVHGGGVGGSITGDCSLATFSCSSLYGNLGGDWVECIADQLGADGNFSADPLFCGADSDDFRLQAGSPCLPESSNGCGLIGAFGPSACVAPGIVQISTQPVGRIVFGDHDYRRGPTTYRWELGSEHTVGTIPLQALEPGTRARFLGWSDGGDVERTIIVPDTLRLEATFDTEHLIRMVSSDGGTTSPSAWTVHGTTRSITAFPRPGFEFVRWTGGGNGSYQGTENPATVTALSPLLQAAHFTNVGSHLRMFTEGEGVVTPEPGVYTADSEVTIEAIPHPQFAFTGWQGAGDGSYTGLNNPAVITMSGPILQTATFRPVRYEVTLSLSDTDPYVYEGSPIGFGDVHLWLACGAEDRGMTEVRLSVVSTMNVLGFVPAPGILSSGTATSVAVSPQTCSSGPILLGRFLVASPGSGGMCLNGASPTHTLTVADCAGTEFAWPSEVGFSGVQTDGLPPCRSGRGCDGSQVESEALATPTILTSPTQTSLMGIFPNPISGTGTIRFDLAKGGQVELTIYNTAGRLVRMLVSAHHPPGSHSVDWDGHDGDGRAVGSGVYFVRMSAQGSRHVQKVTVLE